MAILSRIPRWAIAVTLALAVGLPAAARDVTDPDGPRSLPAAGAVSVRWRDPATFQELRHSGNRFEARRGDWVADLAKHIRKRASEVIAGGQTLEVDITDIRRAGDFEPGRGPDLDHVRVVRDIHSPEVAFAFTLRAPDGRTLASGERRLRDPGFLQRGGSPTDTDPLRYEKRLVDDWVRGELRKASATG